MSSLVQLSTRLAEAGIVPDGLMRLGIRRLIGRRVQQISSIKPGGAATELENFVAMMDSSEVAPLPELANSQHYEVPAEFYAAVLGPNRKYSCCFWGNGTKTLEEAESAALSVTMDRAGLRDNQNILELGCGWGSLTLWAAKRLPNSSITAVSNSASQKKYIEERASALGLNNVTVIAADMNDFDTPEKFDRVVSLEMFEHMRNYRTLFKRISGWLTPNGKFFMHIFCHRQHPYEFIDQGPSDWMSRHFFSGGIMPSRDLPLQFQGDLRISERWFWNGREYQKTAEAWLSRMDSNKADIMPVLASVYGNDQADRWWLRWRLFFMSVSELFGYDQGRQWMVGHYLFTK